MKVKNIKFIIHIKGLIKYLLTEIRLKKHGHA